jgi:integrase
MGRGPGVRSVGREAIQIDFRWRGVRYRERLRLRPTAANLKYAARLKATLEHEIAIGTFDYAKHFPRSVRRAAHAGSAGIGLKSAMLGYLDSLRGQLEPETLDKYRHDAASVAGWFPEKTLQSLTRADVRNKVASLALSRKRILNLLTPLRGALGQAVDDGTLTQNPLSGFRVRRIEAPTEKIDPFTREEVDRLSRTELGALWEFWAWAGLRPGEIIGLQWRDVGADGGSVTVRRSVRVGREKRPKTAAGERMVRLVPPARAALARLRRGEPGRPVFLNPTTGERWHEDRGLARAFRKACQAAQVRYRPAKQLRHTFASWALSSGENPLWVAKQMGHKDVTMIFKVYGKYMPDMNPTAGQKMSRSRGKRRAA